MIGELIDWFSDGGNWTGDGSIGVRMLEHLGYTALALLCASAIAIPFGLVIGHRGRGGVVLVGLSNAIRAIPTLGLITFLFLLVTQAGLATFIGLVVLAVPPILAGTYAGVAEADDAVTDAATGMGMTGWQRLLRVEVPIALPLLIGGLRNAALQVIATAAVAAYVGLGGLGRYLIDGLSILDYGQVAAGALLTAILAIGVDLVLAGLSRTVVPKGLRLAAATRTAGRGSQ